MNNPFFRIANGLPKPNSHKQEVLLHLIQHGSVSILNFPYLSGFRTRISELRDELDITDRMEKKVSKYGNEMAYAVHSITDRDKAISVYKRINKETLKTIKL
jgi:hypothetical protein